MWEIKKNECKRLPLSANECHCLPNTVTVRWRQILSAKDFCCVPETVTSCQSLPKNTTVCKRMPLSTWPCHCLPETVTDCQIPPQPTRNTYYLPDPASVCKSLPTSFRDFHRLRQNLTYQRLPLSQRLWLSDIDSLWLPETSTIIQWLKLSYRDSDFLTVNTTVYPSLLLSTRACHW